MVKHCSFSYLFSCPPILYNGSTVQGIARVPLRIATNESFVSDRIVDLYPNPHLETRSVGEWYGLGRRGTDGNRGG